MQPLIDRLAYTSKLSTVRVRDKLLFCMPPLFLCILVQSPLLHSIVIAGMLLATLGLAGAPLKAYCKLLLLPTSFLLLSMLSIWVTGLPTGTSALLSFYLFGTQVGLTIDSLYMGLTLFVRAFSAICCLYFLVLTTPMNHLLTFLRKTPLPNLLIDLMELIYRFIFTIWEQATQIHLAQETRLGYVGLRRSFTSLGQLIAGVLLNAIIRTDRIQLCLESRGFQGNFACLAQKETPSPYLGVIGLSFTLLLYLAQVGIFLL